MDKYQRLITEYCKENELSENTRLSYLDCLEKYRRRYGYEFNKHNMLDFKMWLLDEYKPKTVYTRIYALNLLLDLLGKSECKVKQVKIQMKNHVENVITDNQYKKLCDGLLNDGNIRMYWRIQILAKTGARVSELIQMQKKHLTSGEIVLYTKGKVRTIYIPTFITKESKEYFDTVDSEWLFPSHDKNKHISARSVNSSLIKMGERYDIPKNVMHAHSFRHFFAIKLMQKSKDITLVGDLLGHSRLSTTMMYTRISKEEQSKKLSRAIDW